MPRRGAAGQPVLSLGIATAFLRALSIPCRSPGTPGPGPTLAAAPLTVIPIALKVKSADIVARSAP
ncbi:MAG TPA: hypothetical protein VGB36_15805 [Gammaproteobacteria bacterium]